MSDFNPHEEYGFPMFPGTEEEMAESKAIITDPEAKLLNERNCTLRECGIKHPHYSKVGSVMLKLILETVSPHSKITDIKDAELFSLIEEMQSELLPIVAKYFALGNKAKAIIKRRENDKEIKRLKALHRSIKDEYDRDSYINDSEMEQFVMLRRRLIDNDFSEEELDELMHETT